MIGRDVQGEDEQARNEQVQRERCQKEQVQRRTGQNGQMGPGRPPFRLTGSGPAMMKLRDEIERAARADFSVLIEGETGAGKEMVARQIHQWSRRRKGPWVAVNCAALVDSLVESELFGIEDRTATGVRGRRGKIEMAHNGTLFLDEVAELSPHVQAKLLRVLQDFVVERVGGQESRRVSARLIVATNRSLGPLVKERVFRQDLFYRVNLLTHPGAAAARAARRTWSDLARAFLAEHRDLGITRVSPGALEVLRTYEWPGNVRELFNVLADSIDAGDGARQCGDCDSRPAGGVEPALPGGVAAVDRAWRFDAGVGGPLCAAGVGAVWQQQAEGLSAAGHQLSHAAGLL